MAQFTPTFTPQLDHAKTRVAVITARFNTELTRRLEIGVIETLRHHGVQPEHIEMVAVPGAFELPAAARHVIHTQKPDVVITLGCVIRGETPHFDYVCQSVTQGVMHLNVTQAIPVIFGVLTVENHAQAENRLGGSHGHKGQDCALAALEMVELCLNKARKQQGETLRV